MDRTVNVVVAHTDPCARRDLATPLRASGYDVEEAADYAQALHACQRHEPDVALVSKCIESPRGGLLLDELKAHPEVFSTAVVLVAPKEMSFAQAQELLGRGAADLLIEPVTPAEVLARVRSATRTKTLQEELVGQSRRLETLLHEDPLTGLFNRRYVLTRLEGLISGARRHGRQLSVAMIDLDRFKDINDQYGHDAGDCALIEITQRAARPPARGGRARPPRGRGVPRPAPRHGWRRGRRGGRGPARERSGGRGALPRARARRDGQHRLGLLGRPGGPGRAGQTSRRRALRSQGGRAERRAGSRESLC